MLSHLDVFTNASLNLFPKQILIKIFTSYQISLFNIILE
jgi:hypothetical protein